MADCQFCKQPIVSNARSHHAKDYVPKFCNKDCMNQALAKRKEHICKVCKKPFMKRVKGSVCCSPECVIKNKIRVIRKKTILEAMLTCRFGEFPNWTAIGKKLKCSHRTIKKKARALKLIDLKGQGPIVKGEYVAIPEQVKVAKPPDLSLTSKEAIEKELLLFKKVDEKGCWLWDGHLNVNGYGVLYLPPPYDKEYLAKNLAFYVWNDIPFEKEKYLFHKCKNRRCFNPDHMIMRLTRKGLAGLFSKYKATITPLGKKHPRWLIDLPMALDIRDGILAGETNAEIVKRLGVKTDIVNRIRRRKSWAYIWKLKHEYVSCTDEVDNDA